MYPFLEDIKDRIKNVYLYNTLLSLKQKEKYKEYDLVTISMSTLLFILERMFNNENEITHRTVAKFLGDLIKNMYGDILGDEKEMELSIYLIDILMNEGSPFKYNIKDPNNGEDVEISFRILEYSKDHDLSKLKTKSENLKLTSEGLELLFKTKEFEKEIQISINQIYLRQQIERGIFDGAVSTSKELLYTIEMQHNELAALESSIRKDAFKIATENKLNDYLNFLHEHFKKQKEDFNDLKSLIKQTFLEISINQASEKEIIALNNMKKVQNNVERAFVSHNKLFSKKNDIKTLMLNSLENNSLNAFNTKININLNIIEELNDKVMPIDDLFSIIKPLLNVKSPFVFNQNKIFEPQIVTERNVDIKTEIDVISEEDKLIAEENEKKLSLEKSNLRKTFLKNLFDELLVENEITLIELMDKIKTNDIESYNQLTKDEFIFMFLINLHQEELIKITSVKKEYQTYLSGHNREIAELVDENNDYRLINTVIMIPDNTSNFKTDKYSIENIKFIGGK